MTVTISTHNGSTAHRSHNIREPRTVDKQEHIDKNGHYEVWRDEPPKQAYQRIFGQAVKDYNDKQPRQDRKITDYYKQVCQSKTQHPIYEMIVAVGSKDNPIDEVTGKEILKDYCKGWDSRNPNLAMIGAYYHADEQGVPHLHIDYVPVAHGYVRGLAIRNGLDKALREQGYIKKGRETPQIQWERTENKALERLCRSRGIEVEHPAKQAEKALKHRETKVYQRTKDIDRLEQKVSFREQEVQAKEKEITAKAQSIEKAEKTITVKGKELSEQSAQLDKDLQDLRSFANRPDKVEPVKVGISRKEYVPYKDYEKTYDTMSNALTAAERAESRVKQLSRQVASQSKSLLERQVEAERSARQKAEDRARQAEDRLQAKESDKDVARSQALYDVLSAVGINDWKEQQRLKKLYDKSEQEHFRQNREQEQQRQHKHDRGIDRER